MPEQHGMTDEEAIAGGLAAVGGARPGEAVAVARPAEPGREVFLRVAEALPFDINHGIARLDRAAFEALGLRPGSLVQVAGRRRTVVRVELAPPGLPGRHVVRLDG